MNHQRAIKLKNISAVVCLMLALPLAAEEQAVDLKMALPTLQTAEKPEFLDKVWRLQDYELIGLVLKEGDTDLLKYFKIKLGNAPVDEFKSKVSVLFLRAPEKFWNGVPPSSGSGTIDFSARRAILEVLAENLGEENLSLEDIDDSEERKTLADKLEKAIGVKLPQIFSDEIMHSPRNNLRGNNLDGRFQTESANRANQKEETQENVDETKQSNLLWIVAGVLVVGILAMLLKVWMGRSVR